MKYAMIFAAGVWACFTGLNTIDNMRPGLDPAAVIASYQQSAQIADAGALAKVEIIDRLGDQTLVKTEDERRFVIPGVWGAKGETFQALASQLLPTQKAAASLPAQAAASTTANHWSPPVEQPSFFAGLLR